MGGGENLGVVHLGRPQYQAPELALQRVVDAVLRFVDEENAISAVGKRERDAEHPRRAIAEAPQRQRSWMICEPDHDAPADAAYLSY